MLRVPITLATPGMTLALPVPHPKRAGTVLLRSGVTMDDRSPARLKELGVGEVWIQCPGLDHLAKFISPAVTAAGHALARQIESALDNAATAENVPLEYTAYKDTISGFLQRLAETPAAAVFIDGLSHGGRAELRHAGNGCMLSLLLGMKLEFYLVNQRSRLTAARARELTSLGLGAMLRDIGMAGLDPAVRERWARTGDQSDLEWRRHPELGFERTKTDLEPAAAAVILHHHQRFDGTGFPCIPGLSGGCIASKGSDIHIFARIVAAADLFDRLRFGPSGLGDTPTPVVRVLKTIRGEPYRRWIDPIVMMALLHVVPAYAPGSLVHLSDGRQCVVTDWRPTDPCRPMVHEVKAGPETSLIGDPIDLALDHRLGIAISEGQDVSGDNFHPACQGEFDLHRAGRDMGDRSSQLTSQAMRRRAG